ncbi:MAG: hypothetical protein JXR78_11140 [Victivallales bacterium]|nr:hypothetical protein [Victivallales bacterium]
MYFNKMTAFIKYLTNIKTCLKLLILLLGMNTGAETLFEDFERSPARNGWLTLGDRATFSWNEQGWMDVKKNGRVSRFVKALKSPPDKNSPFFFSFDLMTVGKNIDDGCLRGLMAPAGDKFNNFIGSISATDKNSADVISPTGKGLSQAPSGGEVLKPYILRVKGHYRPHNGKGILNVKVFDLLEEGKEVSASELIFDLGLVDFSRLSVFGIGNRMTNAKKKNLVRYDNLYFSTKEENPRTEMPSFISCDLVTVENVELISSANNLKVNLDVASSINAENVVVRGSLLQVGKLPGDEAWMGDMGTVNLSKNSASKIEYDINGLKPVLWTPANPQLYTFKVGAYKDGKVMDEKEFRLGFKDFKAENGMFMIDGKPVFLRGSSLNPPAENVLENIGQRKDFIKDYIRDLKLRNINIIRMQSQDYSEQKNWLEVCDEMGMMVIQGCYGIPPGATKESPPNDISEAVKAYKDQYLRNFLFHPSVVIQVLSSNVGTTQAGRDTYYDWLERLCRRLQAWNPGSIFLASAGAPACKAGEINDMHFYSGWYYGSFLDYLNLRKPEADVSGSDRPFTLSECVGAFTSTSGGFPIKPGQTPAALCWGGDKYGDPRTAMHYQTFLVKQAIEQFRRFRKYNPRLAGIMPYFQIYSKWQNVRTFREMRPKPSADQMRTSFQPVLLSWENWTPHKYSGTELKTVIHVINDADDRLDIMRSTVHWELFNFTGQRFAGGRVEVPELPYYDSRSFDLSIPLGKDIPPGSYRLIGNLRMGTRLIASNETNFFIADNNWVMKDQTFDNSVRLYDPSDEYAEAFKKIGIKFAQVRNFSGLRKGNVLVIGKGADADISSRAIGELDDFIKSGGVVLVLEPSESTLKIAGNDALLSATALKEPTGVFINSIADEKVLFSQLPDSALSFWSDPNGWNESMPGMPLVTPAVGAMTLKKSAGALKGIRVLANFGRGLENMALVQVGYGEGAVLYSTFDFISRAGFDPVADRLLVNIFSYCASEKKKIKYPAVAKIIKWGDYKSEAGIIPSPQYGLLLQGAPGKELSLLGNVYNGAGRSISGPFRFNSLNEAFMLGGDNSPGEACVYVEAPAQSRNMISVVRNPATVEYKLEISINGKPGTTTTVAPEKTARINNPLPGNARQLAIQFNSSGRELILLETHFQ